MADSNGREHWSGNLGFIMAATGSAVGLGNIWKFPYLTGENGGGAFVLIYLICITVIGLPIMICEITLGRHTQRNPVGAFSALNPKNSNVAHFFGLSMMLIGFFLLCFQQWGWGVLSFIIGGLIFRFRWTVVGFMGVLAGFVILSYYSVVAGWTLGYIWYGMTGSINFVSGDTTLSNQGIYNAATDLYNGFLGNSGTVIFCHFLFMVLCIGIVCRGIKGGIEKWSKILMPLLFVLLLALILRGITLKGAMAGVHFYLNPDFNKIKTATILKALGQAFFSLSLGMGAMITYGSYLDKNKNIFTSSMSIVALDTLVALMAGLAIFPAVFALGFEPTEGTGLVFKVIPAVFSQIKFGFLWASLFFLLLLVAALTSGISLLEVVTAYFVDELKWSRVKATIILGTMIFILGCLTAVSIENWDRIVILQKILVAIFGSTSASFLVCMDSFSQNWLLPLGGLFISIFVGWIWGTRKAVDEIRNGSHNFADVHLTSLMAGLKDDPSHNSEVHVVTLASVWGIFIRFISPIAITIAFLNAIGWLTFSTPHPDPANKPLPTAEQPLE